MEKYRLDFPMLKQEYIYFNNASTTYKPQVVIDSIKTYYEQYGVNINRGVDSLGHKVTEMYEDVRKKVARFINAKNEEVIFTRGTTEGLNLVANSFGEMVVNKGDEVIVSIYEHHANFIPWQELCNRKEAKLIILTSDDGKISPDLLKNYMSEKTKIVALNHVSNVMGTTNDIKELAKIVHKFPAYFVVDGAQGIVNESLDIRDSNIDFYAFSAHKLYGPMGVGVLYGKYDLLDKMVPTNFGGEMICTVTIEKATYKKPPYRFEAGTMMVPEVLGLGTAIDYINSIGQVKMYNYVKDLRQYLVNKLLKEIPDIIIYNLKNEDSHFVTFNIKNIHAHDVASVLDHEKIIVRAGHHCAEPLMNYLSVEATVRVSLAFYNNKEECDSLVSALKKVGDYVDILFK